jgi:CRISPR/Cas system-associated exonuclease Cas4 (RecB family)
MEKALMPKESSSAISSEDRDKLDYLKSRLDDLCADIAAKFSIYDSRDKPRKAFILDTLMKYTCAGCIIQALARPYENRADIDALYRENHRLAVNMLTQYLQFRLKEEGFNVVDECEGEFGRVDVLVKPTNIGVSLQVKNKEVIIEVKTGRSLSYNQIFRYLFERPDATVIIWRVIMRQILVIRHEQTIHVLFTYMENTIRRAETLLNKDEAKRCAHDYFGKSYPIKNLQKLVDDFMAALIDMARVGDAVLQVLLSNK